MFYFVANHVLRTVNYNTFLTRACQVILPLLHSVSHAQNN